MQGLNAGATLRRLFQREMISVEVTALRRPRLAGRALWNLNDSVEISMLSPVPGESVALVSQQVIADAGKLLAAEAGLSADLGIVNIRNVLLLSNAYRAARQLAHQMDMRMIFHVEASFDTPPLDLSSNVPISPSLDSSPRICAPSAQRARCHAYLRSPWTQAVSVVAGGGATRSSEGVIGDVYVGSTDAPYGSKMYQTMLLRGFELCAQRLQQERRAELARTQDECELMLRVMTSSDEDPFLPSDKNHHGRIPSESINSSSSLSTIMAGRHCQSLPIVRTKMVAVDSVKEDGDACSAMVRFKLLDLFDNVVDYAAAVTPVRVALHAHALEQGDLEAAAGKDNVKHTLADTSVSALLAPLSPSGATQNDLLLQLQSYLTNRQEAPPLLRERLNEELFRFTSESSSLPEKTATALPSDGSSANFAPLCSKEFTASTLLTRAVWGDEYFCSDRDRLSPHLLLLRQCAADQQQDRINSQLASAGFDSIYRWHVNALKEMPYGARSVATAETLLRRGEGEAQLAMQLPLLASSCSQNHSSSPPHENAAVDGDLDRELHSSAVSVEPDRILPTSQAALLGPLGGFALFADMFLFRRGWRSVPRISLPVLVCHGSASRRKVSAPTTSQTMRVIAPFLFSVAAAEANSFVAELVTCPFHKLVTSGRTSVVSGTAHFRDATEAYDSQCDHPRLLFAQRKPTPLYASRYKAIHSSTAHVSATTTENAGLASQPPTHQLCVVNLKAAMQAAKVIKISHNKTEVQIFYESTDEESFPLFPAAMILHRLLTKLHRRVPVPQAVLQMAEVNLSRLTTAELIARVLSAAALSASDHGNCSIVLPSSPNRSPEMTLRIVDRELNSCYDIETARPARNTPESYLQKKNLLHKALAVMKLRALVRSLCVSLEPCSSKVATTGGEAAHLLDFYHPVPSPLELVDGIRQRIETLRAAKCVVGLAMTNDMPCSGTVSSVLGASSASGERQLWAVRVTVARRSSTRIAPKAASGLPEPGSIATESCGASECHGAASEAETSEGTSASFEVERYVPVEKFCEQEVETESSSQIITNPGESQPDDANEPAQATAKENTKSRILLVAISSSGAPGGKRISLFRAVSDALDEIIGDHSIPDLAAQHVLTNFLARTEQLDELSEKFLTNVCPWHSTRRRTGTGNAPRFLTVMKLARWEGKVACGSWPPGNLSNEVTDSGKQQLLLALTPQSYECEVQAVESTLALHWPATHRTAKLLRNCFEVLRGSRFLVKSCILPCEERTPVSFAISYHTTHLEEEQSLFMADLAEKARLRLAERMSAACDRLNRDDSSHDCSQATTIADKARDNSEIGTLTVIETDSTLESVQEALLAAQPVFADLAKALPTRIKQSPPRNFLAQLWKAIEASLRRKQSVSATSSEHRIDVFPRAENSQQLQASGQHAPVLKLQLVLRTSRGSSTGEAPAGAEECLLVNVEGLRANSIIVMGDFMAKVVALANKEDADAAALIVSSARQQLSKDVALFTQRFFPGSELTYVAKDAQWRCIIHVPLLEWLKLFSAPVANGHLRSGEVGVTATLRSGQLASSGHPPLSTNTDFFLLESQDQFASSKKEALMSSSRLFCHAFSFPSLELPAVRRVALGNKIITKVVDLLVSAGGRALSPQPELSDSLRYTQLIFHADSSSSGTDPNSSGLVAAGVTLRLVEKFAALTKDETQERVLFQVHSDLVSPPSAPRQSAASTLNLPHGFHGTPFLQTIFHFWRCLLLKISQLEDKRESFKALNMLPIRTINNSRNFLNNVFPAFSLNRSENASFPRTASLSWDVSFWPDAAMLRHLFAEIVVSPIGSQSATSAASLAGSSLIQDAAALEELSRNFLNLGVRGPSKKDCARHLATAMLDCFFELPDDKPTCSVPVTARTSISSSSALPDRPSETELLVSDQSVAAKGVAIIPLVSSATALQEPKAVTEEGPLTVEERISCCPVHAVTSVASFLSGQNSHNSLLGLLLRDLYGAAGKGKSALIPMQGMCFEVSHLLGGIAILALSPSGSRLACIATIPLNPDGLAGLPDILSCVAAKLPLAPGDSSSSIGSQMQSLLSLFDSPACAESLRADPELLSAWLLAAVYGFPLCDKDPASRNSSRGDADSAPDSGGPFVNVVTYDPGNESHVVRCSAVLVLASPTTAGGGRAGPKRMLLVAHEAASVAAARKGMFEALCKEALPQDLATVLLRKEGSCDVTTKINDVRAWGLNRVCLAQQAAKKKKN